MISWFRKLFSSYVLFLSTLGRVAYRTNRKYDKCHSLNDFRGGAWVVINIVILSTGKWCNYVSIKRLLQRCCRSSCLFPTSHSPALSVTPFSLLASCLPVLLSLPLQVRVFLLDVGTHETCSLRNLFVLSPSLHPKEVPPLAFHFSLYGMASTYPYHGCWSSLDTQVLWKHLHDRTVCAVSEQFKGYRGWRVSSLEGVGLYPLSCSLSDRLAGEQFKGYWGWRVSSLKGIEVAV
jgi:hypothetical protein